MTQDVVESRRTPTSTKKSRWANGTLNWHSENTLNLNFFSWLNKCLISMQCIKWAYYRLSSPWRFVYSRLRDEMTALRPKISSDQESLSCFFRLSACPTKLRRRLYFVLLQSSIQRCQEVIMRWVVSCGKTNRVTVIFSACISCIGDRNEPHLYLM